MVPAVTTLPTEFGPFRAHGFPDGHVALVRGELTRQPVLTRIHSSCLTSEAFGSQRCDCAQQLRAALAAIAARGQGVVVYLQQEGRGIGLLDKLRSYHLQDMGLDTVEANLWLGHPVDARDFRPAVRILKSLGVEEVELMTSNPAKVDVLERAGFRVTPSPLRLTPHPASEPYLETKRARMGHDL